MPISTKWLSLIVLSLATPLQASENIRTVRDLSGRWQFQRVGAKTWKAVTVPSTFQSHEGNEFHGIGWYTKTLDPFEIPKGKRALLHFQAAATLAEVWWNGEKLGSHLGGWTPFRFDVTDLVKKAPKDKPHEIRVKLDEKVGHNTQGFLPIIEPHYGGLWQGVQLLIVPETYFDDLRVLAIGNVDRSAFELELPRLGKRAGEVSQIEFLYRLRGDTEWSRIPIDTKELEHDRLLELVSTFKSWSPQEPNLYECKARLFLKEEREPVDEITFRAAFRKIEAKEDQLLLNGKPLQVRGILNWGYYPPNLAPNPSEKQMRQDIELAKSMGFNLMKFCLWMPPKRFFELCDEMGFLAW
ncbi:MAG TPA: hypothetical protein VGZ25_12530, partial [Gemmataceae bacterium]|nr:hypothetical protein [Gemmataceae bacterium]